MAIELPRVITLNHKESAQYWGNLDPNMRYQYGGRPNQFGHPVSIPVSLAHEIHGAASATLKVVKEKINSKNGLTSFMDGRSPVFGPHHLNDELINRQLESRLEKGFELPIIYDVILTDLRGLPTLRVVELQSGIAYTAEHLGLLKAAGFDAEDPRVWYGPENPLSVMNRTKQEIAFGGNITVMDTNPFGGTFAEQVGMSKILGEQDSLPISVLDVDRDAKGYFHYKYAVDPLTFGPVKNESGEGYKKTDEKVRIEHVMARMTQPDLDRLFSLVSGDIEKEELIKKFLMDNSVNWVWHPNWQYIISKDTLPLVRKSLIAEGSKFADHYVPVFEAGELVEPGTYIKKPTNAVSGMGQSEIVVSDSEKILVEDEYVYQQKFIPYPLKIEGPTHITDSFIVPDNADGLLKEQFGKGRCATPGTLELRYMPTPYGKESLSGWFLARLAPRWNTSTDAQSYTQTNLGKIMDAMYATGEVNEKNFQEYPFGWCPVIVE